MLDLIPMDRVINTVTRGRLETGNWETFVRYHGNDNKLHSVRFTDANELDRFLEDAKRREKAHIARHAHLATLALKTF